MISRLLSLFVSPFAASPPSAGARLYAHLIAPAHLATLMAACRQTDTFTGRFETLALAAALHLEPWARAWQASPAIVQRDFIQALVADINTSFRERSLGDATVKKHATNHAAAFYGRLNAYGQSVDQATLIRNLFGGDPSQAQHDALPHIISDLKQALNDQINDKT